MPRIARVHAGLAACFLFACAAMPAQERKPLVGRVLDAAGAPAAGATVTLAWSPPGGEDCGPADVVKAVTDERGRFVAQVFGQESYSAWAVLPLDGSRARATAVRNHVAAGADLELRFDREVLPHILNLEGASAYAGIGPLRLQVAPRAANLALFEVTVNGPAAFLPSVGLIVARDQQGDVLFARGVPDSTPGGFVFTLPPAATLEVRVLGPDRKPLAGAMVRHSAASLSTMLAADTPFEPPHVDAWRRCGTSAADGSVEILVPWPSAQSALPLLVSAPGMAETCAAVTLAAAETPLEVRLQPAARLRAVRGGAPVAHAEVRLTASYRRGPNFERAATLHLDDAGTCELPLPVDAVETMVHVRSRPQDPWHLQRIPLANGAVSAVDLADGRPLSLQFLDGSGGPVRGMPGVIMAIGSIHAQSQQVPVCTDQAGRLERTLGPDAWVLILCDGVCWARYDVPRRDVPGSAMEFRSTVRCETLPLVRLRVLDAASEAVAGAMLADVKTVPRPGPPGANPAGNQLAGLMQKLGSYLLREARSDAEGALVVRIPPRNQYMLSAEVRAPGHGTVRMFLEPGPERSAMLPAQPGKGPANGGR